MVCATIARDLYFTHKTAVPEGQLVSDTRAYATRIILFMHTSSTMMLYSLQHVQRTVVVDSDLRVSGSSLVLVI